MDLSSNRLISALPRNHAIPNTPPKRPKAVLRLSAAEVHSPIVDRQQLDKCKRVGFARFGRRECWTRRSKSERRDQAAAYFTKTNAKALTVTPSGDR
jgi:hypothetical protein